MAKKEKGGSDFAEPKYKVSKLMIWPSRKVNLGNYSTLDLNAGIEITFETPVNFESKEVEEALEKARKVVGNEFNKQWFAWKPKKKEGE